MYEDIPLVLDNMDVTEELLRDMQTDAEEDAYSHLNLALILLSKARIEVREVGRCK